MSEAFDKVLGIKKLALFPLPLVLLPNELLPLHIFEPRYRQMLEDIALERNLFGISYFDPQDTLAEKPMAGTIGCAAEVRETARMADGRSNILTIGIIRYQLINYVESDAPYFIGEVEFFEDLEEPESELKPLADEVFILFRRVAEAAHKLSGQQGEVPEIVQAEPQALSFLVTAAFNLEPQVKYQMLELRSTLERLKKLREILSSAVGKMEKSADIHKISQTNGHAKTKIDF